MIQSGDRCIAAPRAAADGRRYIAGRRIGGAFAKIKDVRHCGLGGSGLGGSGLGFADVAAGRAGRRPAGVSALAGG